jgi:endonuclease/exonuclease/phosphatase (EEP) superfamily protein YafD
MVQIIAIALLTIIGLLSVSSYFIWSHPLELLSHFRVQYLVLSLIITGILFLLLQKRLLKNKSLIFISLAIVSLNTIEVLPWFLPHAQQASGNTQPQIRIESFNVNVKNEKYQTAIDLVRNDKPDVALFIEINDQWSKNLKAGLKDIFPYSFRSPGGGLLTFSRIPLQDAGGINLDGVGYNLVANLEIDGKLIHFIGTHPPAPVRPEKSRQRNLQLLALEKYIQKINKQQKSVIIAGDFNLTPWSPYYRQFIKKTGLHNTRLGFGILPSWPNPTTYIKNIPTWLMPLINIPIDHCFVSKDLRVINTRIQKGGNSDHAAIIADLVLR